MSPTQTRLIEHQAQSLVDCMVYGSGVGISTPVLADLIAYARFGIRTIRLAPDTFAANTRAALDVNGRTIAVDPRLNFAQRNFAIAHELGHYVLHENIGAIILNGQARFQATLRGAMRSSATAKTQAKRRLREREANQFAAALLIPLRALNHAVSRFSEICAKAVMQLAAAFHVSQTMMRLRIKRLISEQIWTGPPCHAKALHVTQTYTQSVKLETDLFDHFSHGNLPVSGRRRHIPKLIEFAGSPNAGKDTQIAIMNDYLQDIRQVKVRVIDEAVKSCHIDKSLTAERLYQTIAITVVRLYDARFENPGDVDFVIFNRGIFDRLALVRAALGGGQIDAAQAHVHEQYLLAHAQFMDLVLWLEISPEESIEREQKSKRATLAYLAKKEGRDLCEQRILNFMTLKRQAIAYQETKATHEAAFGRIVALHGDDITTNERAAEVRDALLARFFQHATLSSAQADELHVMPAKPLARQLRFDFG